MLKKLSLFFLILITACAGGVGTGGDLTDSGGDAGDGDDGSSGNSGSTGSEDPLFETGPVDIPVNIAKAEAGADPRKIDVEILTNKIKLTGREGAIPTSSSFVYIYDTVTEETTTTAIDTSDGSFAETPVPLSGGAGTYIVGASEDGESINGGPLFLRVDDDVYVWTLTNGDTISSGCLTMAGETTYLCTTSTSSSELNKNARQQTSSTTTTIHALDTGGIPAEMGTLDCAVNQVYAANDQLLARCGADFYLAGDSGFGDAFSMSLASGEEITLVAVNDDPDIGLVAAVATNQGLYSCLLSDGECSSIRPLSTGESIDLVDVTDMQEFGLDFYIMATITTSSTSKVFLYQPDGTLYIEVNETSSMAVGSFNFSIAHLLMASGDDGTTMRISSFIFREGVSSSYYDMFDNNVTSLSSTNSTTAGSSLVTLMSISSSLGTTDCLLNGTLSIRPNSNPSTSILVDARQTRTIYGIQPHPNAQMAVFCATDDDGNGQLYAYSPRLFAAGDSGYEVQLTDDAGGACDASNNWRIDTEETECSIVLVDADNPAAPQIRFIDCNTDPLFDGFFE